MRNLLMVVLPLVLAGCFSVTPPKVKHWTVTPAASELTPAERPTYGEARLAIVAVRSPFDGKEFTVLRSDGSMAFDPFNHFASAPSALIKGAALDVIRGTGMFKGVQTAVTTADVSCNLELIVDEIALDCRTEGSRLASVKLTLAMISKRQVSAAAHGAATVDASSGDYSAAFGEAFTKAVVSAVSGLAK